MFESNLQQKLDFISINEAQEIFTANPGNEKFAKSLGRDSSELSDDEWNQIYDTWYKYRRFFPPERRNDDPEYFNLISKKYNEIVQLLMLNKKPKAEELLSIIGSLGDLKSQPFGEERKEGRSALIKAIYKKIAEEGDFANLFYTKKRPDSLIETPYTPALEDKFVVAEIRKLVETLLGEDHSSDEQDLLYLNSNLDGELLYLEAAQRLLEYSIEGKGELLSAIELLYLLINLQVWRRKRSDQEAYTIGVVAGSMLVFNTILKSMGYEPIPIYAIDFAAYSLDKVGFSAYILYIMNQVEEQEIKHDLPPLLKKAIKSIENED